MKARWLLLAVLAGGLVLTVPGDAQAQLNPCAPKAPAPRRPDTGMPGWFASEPTNPPRPPIPGVGVPPEDLFATYGTAGLWWPTWDLGCSGSAEGLVTDMANLPMDWQSATLNGTASVRALAWEDDWLGPVDDAVSAMADRLSVFFGVGMGLALAAVGVWMIYRARTAEYGEITTAGGWALLLLALAALALSYPGRAGRTYDDYVIGSARLVNDALAGEATTDSGTDPAVAQINGDVAYRVWLRGMFGSDSTHTAEEFGPRFYSAMAFAWSELPTLDAGGPAAEAVVEAHRQAFVAAARALELSDPSAYRTMQGKAAFSTRIPTGLVGWVLVVALAFMAGVAAGLVLVARLVGRGLIMALPVVVPFGALYRWSGPVRKLGSIAQAVAVALITATIAGGLLTRGVGALLSSDWPLWLVGGVALVATFVAWRALKPIGTVAGLVGLGAVSRLPRHAVGAMLTRWGARSGAREGVADGLAAASAANAAAEPAGRVSRAEDYSAAPPPPVVPAPAGLPAAGAVGAVGAAPPPSRMLGKSGPPGGHSRPKIGTEPPRAPSLEPPAPAPPRPAALPAPAGGGPSRPAPPPEPAPEPFGEVLDTHLVIASDGREVYQVYQRPEPALR